jgi:hypothetical protein
MTLRHARAERHIIAIRKGDNVKVIAGRDARMAPTSGSMTTPQF